MDPFLVNTSTDDQSFAPSDASSATRIAASLRDIPMAVSVMTSAVLKDIMPTNVRDGAYYGAGITGGMQNRVGYAADAFYRNIVTNTMYSEGTPLLQTHVFDEPFDLDRIEIIRGPSGIVFGSGNFGGLANRVSKQPRFIKEGTAEINVIDNGFRKAAIDLTGPITSKFAYRLVASYTAGAMSDRQNDRVTHDFIHGSMTWAPTTDTKLTVNLKYRIFNSGSNLFGDFLEGNTIDNLYKFPITTTDPMNGIYTTHYTQFMGWFTLTHNVGNWLSFRTLGALTNQNEKDTYAVPTPTGNYNPTFSPGSGGSTVKLPVGVMDAVFDYLDEPNNSSGIDQDILVKYKASGIDTKTLVTFNAFGFRSNDYLASIQDRRRIGFMSFTYRPAPGNNGIIGIPANVNPYSPSSPYYTPANNILPYSWVIPKTKPSLTSSVQEFITLLDGKVNLSGGYSRNVQHGSEIDVAGTAATTLTDDFSANVVRYGVTVRPISWMTVFAQSNQGFAPPTPRVDPINHSVYGPQTSRDREAGMRLYFFGDRLSLTGTVYRMDLGGLITAYPNPLTQGKFQSGGVIDNGWETTLEGEITPHWSITASINQSDYVLANGQRNLMSARGYGNLYTRYSFNEGALKNFSAGVGMWYKNKMIDGYYKDSTGAQQERDFPNAMVWGLTMQYLWKPFTFKASVSNLFNKFYYTTESSEIFYRGDSRHITFATDYSF